ncbi:hypothetical protein B0H13DRAFT_1889296 [Mycena leptocephala]|nr:hypothetical protein B0H13DRAFT_1889296 [Mycena leptocephala]
MNCLGRKASLLFLPDSHTARDSAALVQRGTNSTPCSRPSSPPAGSPTGTTASLIPSPSRRQASLTGSAEDRPEQPTTTHTIISLNADDLEDYEDLFTLPSQSFSTIIGSVFIDPTSESADGAGTTFLNVGTRKMHVKDDVPKKMAGSTLHQPGRTKPLASGAPLTTATFAPLIQPSVHFQIQAFQDKLDNVSPVMSKPAAKMVMKVKQKGTKEPAPASEAHK